MLRSLKYKSKVLEENFEIRPVPDPLPEIKSLQKKISSFTSYTQGFESTTMSKKFKIEGVGFSFTQKKYIRPFDEDSNHMFDSSTPLFRRSNSANPNAANAKNSDSNGKFGSAEKGQNQIAFGKSKTQSFGSSAISNSQI